MPNPITEAMFYTTPLYYGLFSGFLPAGAVGTKAGLHSIFDPAQVRVTMQAGAAGANGTSVVTINKDNNGDTIYLSYFTNEISSVVLTNPPIAGVTKFTTDNLSGCKVFVDRIGATNNLILYHANARAQSPPANQGAANPTLQTVNAANTLDNLHTTAQGDYAAAPYNYARIATVGSIDKPAYNQQAGVLVQRKYDQGRRRLPQPHEPADPQRVNRPEFTGGTVVFGFFANNRWEILYQTWGAVEYRRPKSAVGAILKWGRDAPAAEFKMVQFGRIYPNPYNSPVAVA